MIVLERRFPYEPQPFLRREFWTDLLWFSTVFSVLMGFAGGQVRHPGHRPAHRLEYQPRGIREWPLWIQVAGLTVHARPVHLPVPPGDARNRFLWRIHEAHHSTPDVDWVGGSRGHVIENMITGTAELAPIVFFMSPEVAAIKSVIDACWGMWIHANIDWSTGEAEVRDQRAVHAPLAPCPRGARRELRDQVRLLGLAAGDRLPTGRSEAAELRAGRGVAAEHRDPASVRLPEVGAEGGAPAPRSEGGGPAARRGPGVRGSRRGVRAAEASAADSRVRARVRARRRGVASVAFSRRVFGCGYPTRTSC